MIDKLQALWRRWQIFRIYRKNLRRWLAEQKMRAAIKGRILQVGTCERLRGCPKELYHVEGEWMFCGANGALPHRKDANGINYYYGYTIQELNEISRRRAEWVESTQC